MVSYDRDGRSAKQRAKDALQLRLMGASYETIAQQLHYRSASGAYAAVRAELEREAQAGSEDAAAEIQMEKLRLDRLLRAVWPSAINGNPQAVDRVLRIQERRAEYAALTAAATPPPQEDGVVVSISRGRDARKARAAGQ